MRSLAEIKRAWDAGFWIPREEEAALKRGISPAVKRKDRATNGSKKQRRSSSKRSKRSMFKQ